MSKEIRTKEKPEKLSKKQWKALRKRVFYHGLSGDKQIRVPLFVTYDREYALGYSPDESEVAIVTYDFETPLIIKNPQEFAKWWKESGCMEADKQRIIEGSVTNFAKMKSFHPYLTYMFANYIESKGYDSVCLEPSAFEGEEGYKWVAGTFGEPQCILFDLKKIHTL